MQAFEHGIKEALPAMAEKLEDFSLNQPKSVWFVDIGHIDIFAVSLVNGRFEGAKHHVFRASEKKFLLGCDPFSADMSYGFLAIATPGTVFYRLDPARLAPATMLKAIESWITLITTHAPVGLQSKHYISTGREHNLQMQKGTILSTKDPLIWIVCTKGMYSGPAKPDKSLRSTLQ